MMIEEKLKEIYLQRMKGANLDLDYIKENSTEFYLVLLLSSFSYNVNQGGFAQLIYNLNGLYLEDLELSLEMVRAKKSKKILSSVIKYCLEDKEGYRAFVNSNFEESSFKNGLLKISLDYFSSNYKLENEISKKMFNNICKAAKNQLTI